MRLHLCLDALLAALDIYTYKLIMLIGFSLLLRHSSEPILLLLRPHQYPTYIHPQPGGYEACTVPFFGLAPNILVPTLTTSLPALKAASKSLDIPILNNNFPPSPHFSPSPSPSPAGNSLANTSCKTSLVLLNLSKSSFSFSFELRD